MAIFEYIKKVLAIQDTLEESALEIQHARNTA